ncbi:MAG: hypothetical protein NTW50_02880 [Candidatus Berkelbacteria bacterium]|nr:hypothetical protein [Candidatus Berkelbacteria bacterium]
MTQNNANNSPLADFGRQIIKDKRYIALLLLFLMLLFFGKNVKNSDISDDSLNQTSKTQIASNTTSYTISDVLDTRAGENYRLLYQIKARSTYDTNGSALTEKIVFGLSDKLGNEKIVQSVDVPLNSHEFTNEDIIFNVDREYQSVFFRKADLSSPSEVTIPTYHLVRLDGSSNLLSSLDGSLDISHPTETFKPDDSVGIADTSAKNIIVGETFTAQNDYLSSVSFKLHFRGSGGSGNYQLIMREVKDGAISGPDLSNLSFDEIMAENTYQTDSTDGIYNFPVRTKLMKGKQYFIGIDNSRAVANFFNNLQIFGSSDGIQNRNGIGYKVEKNNKLVNEIGDVYLEYFFADQPIYNNIRANLGDSFDDRGNGTGNYSYSKNSLDLFATDKGFNVYRLNTFFPFSSLYIEVGLNTVKLSDNYHVFYSFDNQNWHEIIENSQVDQISFFRQKINGDISNSVIYIKATGTAQNKAAWDFDSLDVNATVNINR